ncbi:MAG: hypothetical protein ICV60_14155 [Pyrinomonadaceae bacterium]|nr:hypothetical protein [Pyrinomonadaceae bacterium]
MAIKDNLLQKVYSNTEGRQILYFNNSEAFLAGIYPDIQKLDGVHGDQSSFAAGNVDFGPQLERLARYRNNFFRHWVIFYPNFVNAGPEKECFPNLDKTKDEATGLPKCTEKAPSVTSGGQPWRERYSPFMYNKILKKWDLWRYNEDYFVRLRKMIQTAYDYGIFVQLTLFDRTGTDKIGDDYCKIDNCSRWPYSPWNAKNNVNKVIDAQVKGVSEFYNRSLPGEIRYIERNRDRDRWPPEPPGPGIPELIIEPTTLGQLQDLYVEKVMQSTVEFPNVCYEIMNEPIGGAEGEIPDRVRWADAIVAVIYRYTQGKRFIFYNDFTPRKAGLDVIAWEKNKSVLVNYSHLDGIIFHGDVKQYEPNNLNPVIRRDLIIQVSTDTFTDQSEEYNRETAKNAFKKHMMFQAEAVEDSAAKGIGDAMPTIFKLPPLCGTWIKTSETPARVPHLFYTQKQDGTVLVFNPDKDCVSMQGAVTQMDSYKLVFWNQTMQKLGRQRYTLKDNNQQLTLVDGDWTQVFKRYQGPLALFFYQWEKISETPATQLAPYFMFVYPDNTLVTRRKDNFAVNNRARITNVTATQITIHSDTLNNETTWFYRFTEGGQKLSLEKSDHSWTQVFRRVV